MGAAIADRRSPVDLRLESEEVLAGIIFSMMTPFPRFEKWFTREMTINRSRRHRLGDAAGFVYLGRLRGQRWLGATWHVCLRLSEFL